jgi:hypothetical protein
MAVYSTRTMLLPEFDVMGFTKIVASGGELYDEVRSDGRWEVLRKLGGDDKTIYGVASEDKECPKGRYRYTLGVKAPVAAGAAPDVQASLFTIHIRGSEWVAFRLDNFHDQYGDFWQADPYKLIKDLGWEFNWAVGLHIDTYAPSFSSDGDPMEFCMPMRPRG